MTKDDFFKFDLDAKRIRITDKQLMLSLQEYAKKVNFRYFSTTEFDKWPNRVARSDTIVSRFGSWNKALKLLGIEGGREREYSPKELIQNLENIWRELGYPPGKRTINKMGLKISEHPYKRIWGGVRAACVYLAKYHEGKISEEGLLRGKVKKTRETIPLNIRWIVLNRDNYRCVKCGQSPVNNPKIDLEIDHIIPVSKGGTNDIDNLQTLCKKCNQGKKNKKEQTSLIKQSQLVDKL